jgi:hypothetical protein
MPATMAASGIQTAIRPPPPVVTSAMSPPIAVAPVAPAILTSPSALIASTPPMIGDPWAGLSGGSVPIVLPTFTLPGDETSSLMLPMAPEISFLPEAYAAAARRFAAAPPAIVTFVDPLTGLAEDDDGPDAAPDQAWLLVDSPDDGHNAPDGTPIGATIGDIGGAPIRWDSHPP